MLTQRRVIAAKVEAVEGTAETLTASEAGILVFAPKADLDIAQYKRDPARVVLSQMPSVSGKRSGKLSFSVELKGSGTAGTAPPILGVLLKGCGFSETVVAVTSVTYKPASSSIPSLTLAGYEDGVIKKLWGARGTVKITAKAGDVVMFDFEFTAADFSVTDGALLAPTYDAIVPKPFLSAAFTLAAYAAIIGKMDLDIGNTVTLRESANSGSGNLSAMIMNREPKGSIDPEMVTVATSDYFGLWRSGTTAAISTVIGATAGNICTITAPAARYSKISDTDKSGIAAVGLDFDLCIGSTGDDELVIAFT